jgi:hypothetical protein
MKHKVEEIGFGQFKKTIALDVKQAGAFRIFALINDGLYHCNDIEALQEYITNVDFLIEELKLGDVVKKYHYFYYVANVRERAVPTAEVMAMNTPKERLEFCIKYNCKIFTYKKGFTAKNKILEEYVMQILREVMSTGNVERTQKLLSTATLIGVDYQYIYNKLI